MIKVEESYLTNLKAFWSYVNSKRKKTEIPNYVSLDGVGASGEKNISNLFALYSKYFYKSFNPTLPPYKASETCAGSRNNGRGVVESN